jgi:hypothetical protein
MVEAVGVVPRNAAVPHQLLVVFVHGPALLFQGLLKGLAVFFEGLLHSLHGVLNGFALLIHGLAHGRALLVDCSQLTLALPEQVIY